MPNTIILSDSTGIDQDATMGSWAILDDFEFSGVATGVENDNQNKLEYSLSNNYPNPFNPTTTIEFSIPNTSFVTLKVLNMLGEEITTLLNEEKPSGKYKVEFNGDGLSSGVYFYKLQSGDFINIKNMILMK